MKRIRELKEEWFDTLPLKFMNLAKNMKENRVDSHSAHEELKRIIGIYDDIEAVERAYVGHGIKNIIDLICMNFVLLIISTVLAILSTSTDVYGYIIIFGGISVAILLYFFLLMAKIINFIRIEEDRFQGIEKAKLLVFKDVEKRFCVT